jgi:hypothetical protein
MNDVDFIIEYSWMESIGELNINVQKKSMKIWYKKRKITLQGESLSKQEGPKGPHEEVPIGKIITIHIEKSVE